MDYLSAAFRLVRQQNFLVDLELPKGLTQRDVRSVRKWVSAFLKLLYPGGGWPTEKPKELLALALELRERVCHELHHYNPTEFPKCAWTQTLHQRDDNARPKTSWDSFLNLWDPAYQFLFRALRDAGLPPPDEGPEDLLGPNGVLGQSLGRWGDKYLLPRGIQAPVKGLEVDPYTDPQEILNFLTKASS